MEANPRKKDIANRLQQIQRECETTLKLVKMLLKSCERTVGEVCDNGFNFDLQYIPILQYLDARIIHILQFNALTDEFLSQGIESYYPRPSPVLNGDVGKFDAPRTRDPMPRPSPTRLRLKPRPKARPRPNQEKAKGNRHVSPRIPTEYKRDPASSPSEQPSSCTDVVNIPSQEKALPVQEEANQATYQDILPGTSEEQHVQVLPPAAISIAENKSQMPCTSSSNSTSIKHTDSFPKSVSRPLNVGDECVVMLSYVRTPGEFYLHIVSEETATIDEFEQKINTFYNNNHVTLKSKSSAKKRMGNLCVCYVPDSLGWYRAQVLDWCLEEDLIVVQLVDYGDICETTLDMIQPILPELIQQPLYATRCHLAFTQPPAPNETWPCESAKVFNCYMPRSTNVNAIQAVIQDPDIPIVYAIIKAEKDEQECTPYEGSHQLGLAHHTSLSVILKDKSDESRLNMNDNLVDLGYADSTSKKKVESSLPIPVHDNAMLSDTQNGAISDRMRDVQNWVLNSLVPRSQVAKAEVFNPPSGSRNSVQEWDPMRDNYVTASNSGENAVRAVSGYDAQDEKRVCKFIANNKRCYKGNNCKMDHAVVHRGGYTSDKELVYTCAFNPLPMPYEDSEILLQVTHVPIGKPYFYCIIPSNGQSRQFEFEEETLTTLGSHINEPKVIKTFGHLEIPPAIGQVVLAFSKSDFLRYHAQVVLELDDYDNTIEVIFVDYGKTEMIHEQNIRAIQPSFLHLPFQAIQCYLANVELGDLQKASEHFKALYLGKRLAAKIVESVVDTQVVHCLLSDTNGKDIGSLLVEAGLSTQWPNE